MGNQLVGVEWNCKWHNVQLGQKLLPMGEANGILDLDSISSASPLVNQNLHGHGDGVDDSLDFAV